MPVQSTNNLKAHSLLIKKNPKWFKENVVLCRMKNVWETAAGSMTPFKPDHNTYKI